MYTLENYLCTSADDAKINLNSLLNTNPKQALEMALSIIKATESSEGKKTLRKTALTIVRKAEKAIKGNKS